MRVHWLYDANSVDISTVCKNSTMSLPTGLMDINSLSLANETSFHCQISHRHGYVSIVDNFIRNYNGNKLYTEDIRYEN